MFKFFTGTASKLKSGSSLAISFILGLGMGFGSIARAAGMGEHSIGIGMSITSPNQEDLNTVISQINASQSVSVDKLGGAYEFTGFYQYRFSSSIFALQFRPSYFMQSSSGGGYNADLKGFTFFPMLRLYPLENNFIKFFMQTGVGYGRLSGKLSGTNGSAEWAGGAFGGIAGLGAEFCFTPSHCMVVEGNVRYLPIERNIVSSSNGNPGFSTAPSNDQELENNNMDVKTTMSGIQGALSYQMYF